MNADEQLNERRHLHRLGNLFPNIEPIFFITLCSNQRERILTSGPLPDIIIQTFKNAENFYGWLVGRYVIMPDHVHFFCIPNENAKPLSDFMKGFKRWTTKQSHACGFSGALWQREFFDHVPRNSASFSEKWEYVRMNPVRAGLCGLPEEWVYSGEIHEYRVD